MSHSPLPTTAPLEGYLEAAYSTETATKRRFFAEATTTTTTTSTTSSVPTLSRGRINRILVYGGCFNPPHIGHMRLLTHAYAHTRDINVIAAVVLPGNDGAVASKYRKLAHNSSSSATTIIGANDGAAGKIAEEVIAADEMVLTQAQRMALMGGEAASEWFWINGLRYSAWERVRSALDAAVARDGFALEWLTLCGPDHVSVEGRGLLREPARALVVSDVSRRADFVVGNGNGGTQTTMPPPPPPPPLRRLRGFTPWRQVTPGPPAQAVHECRWEETEQDELQRKKRKRAEGDHRGDDNDNDESSPRLPPSSTVRYLPATLSSEPAMHISSTQIRKLIAAATTTTTEDLETLRKELQGLVSDPQMLVAMVEQYRRDAAR